jgi:diguanylate cyclase (GGDEF)-like protein
MEETLACELRRASRYGNTVGVIMIDLDGFKQINDQFGHDVSNILLEE